MKKLLSTLAILTASFGIATAEDYSAKNPAPPMGGGSAFDPGFELSGYLAGSFADGGDDEMGGGVGVAYFFTENIGTDFNWAGFAYDDTMSLWTIDLALRMPTNGNTLAPYFIGGGGWVSGANAGSTEGLWRVGGGLDYRPDSLGNIGIFADGTYNWTGGNYPDVAVIRLGFRLPF